MKKKSSHKIKSFNGKFYVNNRVWPCAVLMFEVKNYTQNKTSTTKLGNSTRLPASQNPYICMVLYTISWLNIIVILGRRRRRCRRHHCHHNKKKPHTTNKNVPVNWHKSNWWKYQPKTDWYACVRVCSWFKIHNVDRLLFAKKIMRSLISIR